MITLSVLVVIVLLNDIRAGKTDLHYIWSHLPTKNVSLVIKLEFENVCLRRGEILSTTLGKNRPEKGHSCPQSHSV